MRKSMNTSTFDEANHRRGGNPSNPGQFSPHHAREAGGTTMLGDGAPTASDSTRQAAADRLGFGKLGASSMGHPATPPDDYKPVSLPDGHMGLTEDWSCGWGTRDPDSSDDITWRTKDGQVVRQASRKAGMFRTERRFFDAVGSQVGEPHVGGQVAAVGTAIDRGYVPVSMEDPDLHVLFEHQDDTE